jgi:uncharacterized protein involved in outer membrane biogenesis
MLPPRRRRRRRSYKRPIQIMAAIAVVCALPFAALAIVVATVNPNRLKPRIEAAISQSLGRQFSIHGNVSFRGVLWPTIIADDITVANAPGGSRHDMVLMDEMQMDLSPIAALTGKTVLSNLVLLRPDILLETEPNGVGNWQNAATPPRPAAARPVAPTTPVTPAIEASTVSRITLQTLHVHDAHITWRDRVANTDSVFDVNRISATASSIYSPVTLDAEVAIARHLIEFTAQTGPLSRLQDPRATTPWGLFVNMDTSGAKLTASGSITRPLELRGYSLRVDGVMEDLSRVGWMLPVPLPPLRGVTMSAKLLDQGGPMPDISGITIQSGPTNLEKIASGLSVDIARIDIPRLTESAQIDVEGSMVGAPVKLNGTLGPLALLLPGGRRGEKFPISLTGEAVGATFSARGEIASPATQSGMDVFLSARIPDLSRLSGLLGPKLPPLKSISFDGRLTDTDKGLLDGLTLRDVRFTLPEVTAFGDATWLFRARPGIKANLLVRNMDADALLKQITPELGSAPASSDWASAFSTRGRYAVERPVITAIPATPLPFGLLDIADLDLSLTMGDLKLGGQSYSDIAGHLVLRNGALAIDPFTARLPGGKVELKLDLDASKPAPPIAVALHGPSLELKPLMEAFGWPFGGAGTIDIDADLHAAGASLHAIAATLDGHLDLGLSDVDVANKILGPALAGLSTRVDPSDGDKTHLRCAVLQASADHGMVTISTLVLDSTRFLINVAGTANLDSELFGLSVRPMLRNTGTGVVVPVRVDGTFRNPKVLPNAPTAGAAAASYPSEHGADACGPALAAVRAHPTSVPVAPAAPLATAPASAGPALMPAVLAPPRPNP